ncbi:4'-phosphopantetheinyl transferase family protein [Paenarthrobacter ilicis]|uniref:4'-phosphopantetheinyl transferase n=1 Tax=Paenarthrobacter ilicis TaxID=43665 RepID=A0ABX0TIB7_9MICC|nr:hypothetical protein [Paenarthrobacter ilicis]MBM7791804.1 4'-phosphopantetheinyl transferase [Paenarthrobacter ilicis]NIJ01571.1 4'-phosphopantetheinyl transferase [Paenarthrobacter ilicis]
MNSKAGTPGVGYLIMPSAGVEAACSGAGGMDRFLTAAEKNARRRYRTSADSRDYAASHVLLRLLAAHRLGLDALDSPDLDITRQCPGCGSSAHGRTAMPGMSLSLSRSNGLVMAAVGPAAARVGADVELVPPALFDGFDGYVLSPGTPAAKDVRERMRQWVAKEAILKAAGLGLSVQPSTVALVSDGESRGVLRAECPDQPLVHGLRVHPVPATPTHLAAVSARTIDPPGLMNAAEVLPSGGARLASMSLQISKA